MSPSRPYAAGAQAVQPDAPRDDLHQVRRDQVRDGPLPQGPVPDRGGFNRTNFDGTGGNYITESRADGPRAWRVTGSAFGGSGGGELTAIAYCVKRKDRS